jgi:SAM-dependent methyltransferase
MTRRTRKAEWFDQEDFWRETYPSMFPPERFDQTENEVQLLLRLIKRRRGTVLDLCCGPGRHSVALAKRGFKVTAVDITRFFLNKARKRARDAKVTVEFVRSDMRDFVRPNRFDIALSLFTSFGYFDKKDEDKRVLQHLHQSLRPRGVLVIDIAGKERLAKVFEPTTSTRLKDGTLLVERREIFDDWTRIRNEWIVIKGKRARTFRFHHTLYSGQELRTLLEQAGFSDVKLFGHLDGRPYGPHAPRLVAVSRK